MKMRITFLVASLAALAAGVVRAQSIQGNLDGGKAAVSPEDAPVKVAPKNPDGSPNQETVKQLYDAYSSLPKSGRSVAERLQVDELVVPPYEEFLKTYGAVAEGSIVRFPSGSGVKIKKYDLLTVMNLSDSARKTMRQYFACGQRSGFEVLVAKHFETPKVNLGVIYQCDGSCVGVAEEAKFDQTMWSQRTVGVSRTVDLPKAFCEGLWSGKVTVEDRTNEREIY